MLLWWIPIYSPYCFPNMHVNISLPKLQIFSWLWIVWHMPTTALWPGQTLELIVQLCSAQLPYLAAVLALDTLELTGTFPMEVRSRMMVVFHTTELGVFILGQCCSTATLRVPQQGSSAVTYLMPVEYYRASMLGYMTATLVSVGDGAHSIQ